MTPAVLRTSLRTDNEVALKFLGVGLGLATPGVNLASAPKRRRTLHGKRTKLYSIALCTATSVPTLSGDSQRQFVERQIPAVFDTRSFRVHSSFIDRTGQPLGMYLNFTNLAIVINFAENRREHRRD